MKKILAWVLVLVMVLGMFAGCKKDEPTPTEPAGEVITAQDAIEYLKALYPKSEDAMKTPVNYDRMGIIRIGGIPFTVVWTTDLPEEQIKVIVSEDGATVTMDVNEQCEMDTPYVLTATITDEQGNTASTTWNCLLPQAIDMVALVNEAYALKAGESLPYQATLRGKIVSIDTVWNPEYQNITVTIAVEGAEDKPIQCYRLKGEGAETLMVGNIITVTGTLKNYNGTIEFDAGCMLDAVEQGDAVAAPTDVGEILKAAYKLKKGKSLPYPVTLTGKVTSIDKPFDPAYNNISVVITVDGYKKYPILCYRLKGAGAEDIALEDTITVTGIIKNYEGTIEFDAGCQLVERISGGNTAQKPTDDEAKILKDIKKLKPGEKTPYVAILTGQVFSIDDPYNKEYKNITVTIKVGGMRIQCYRMKGDDVQKIKVTDTITVSGQIENYNGKLEFGNGCMMTDRKAGNGKLKVELGPVENGKIYYAEMKQGILYENLYLNGKINNSGYLQTTKNPAESVQIHAEEVSGKGTRFYFLDGETKTYIEIHTNSDKQRPALVTEPTAYWNYDSELKVYFMDADGIYCALGTYSTYDTVSATKLGYLTTSNIGKDQFVVKYVTEPSEAPVKPETPEQGVIYVDAPVAGTAYKFVLNQAGLGQKLGFTGEMANTYYFGTSEELDKMVDVYLEEAEGGYHIYFMKGNTKTYLNIIPRDNDPTKTNVVMQTKAQNAAPSVYELNTEHKYVKTAAAGDEWYLGTYGTNKTISASQTYRIEDPSVIGATQFVAWFATIGEVTPEQPPVNPDVPPVTPDEPETPAATTATKLNDAPMDGDMIVIYNSGKAMANVPSGNRIGAVDGTVTDDVLALTDEMAQLKVVVEGDKYIFMLGDKYLTSGATGNSMSYADTLTDCARWTLEATGDGAWYIKNVGANYNGNYNQAMEYYNGFTTYGIKTTDIYKMQMFKVDSVEEPAITTTVKLTEAPVAGDMIVIYNSGKAMANVPSGNRIGAVDGIITDDVLALTDEMAQLKVVVEGDKYIFMLGDKYLTSGATGNSMSYADTLTDCARWTLEATGDGAWYIKNVGANYNGNYNQAMEYYNGFTTYGIKTTDIYKMQIFKVVTVQQEPEGGKLTEAPANGDYVVIYNSGKAMAGVPSGNRIGAVDATVTDDVLTITDEMARLKVVVEGDKYIFMLDDKYLTSGATGNSMSYADTLTDCARWTLEATGDGAWYIKNVGANYNGNYNQAMEYYNGFTTYGIKTTDIYKMQLFKANAPANEEPETPPVNPPAGDPEGTVLTIPEAVAMGSAMTHNTTTTVKYKVTGVIDEIVKADYGNVYIKDEAGNRLYVYGIYDITGDIRYDALNPKPVVGDTVTLLGVIGNYNGAQMKSGWLQELIPGTGTNPEQPPVNPEQPPVNPPATGDGILELTVDSMGLANQVYYTGTATVEGIALDLTQIGNYGDGVQMRDKNGNTSVLFNTTALPGKITKIELTYSPSKDVTHSNPDAEIFSFGAAQDNLTYSTKLSTEAGQKTYTITPQGDNTFFKIEHDLGFTFYWESIKIYYETTGTGTNPEQPPVNPEQPPVNPPATGDGILELTVDSMGLANQVYYTGTATVEGIALDLTQIGNYGDGVQMRDKNGNTSVLFNTTALPGKITKIELTYSPSKDVTHSNPDAEIFSFGAAQDNLTYSVKLSTVEGQKTYTITPQGDNTFFKIEHDLGFTFYWESIKVYYEN